LLIGREFTRDYKAETTDFGSGNLYLFLLRNDIGEEAANYTAIGIVIEVRKTAHEFRPLVSE